MNPISIEQLQSRFGIPGVVAIGAGEGGLARLAITTPLASAEIYTHGAHVTAFQPTGELPVLWMSAKSYYTDGKPIRGGVPVIFPWFGPKADNSKAPAHGLVRTANWDVESVVQEGPAVVVTLGFSSSDATKAIWPFDFHLQLEVRITKTLQLSLIVQNRSTSPFDFEEALHTYFTVKDVRQVRVTGLEKTAYLDKTDGAKEKFQREEPITISAETDRVYLDTPATCTLHDPGLRRRIDIEKKNSRATVVWNPWIAKAKAMADFGDDEWPGMICIETVNAGPERVMLAAGESHTMIARIGCTPV